MCFNGIDNEIDALAYFHFEKKTQYAARNTGYCDTG